MHLVDSGVIYSDRKYEGSYNLGMGMYVWWWWWEGGSRRITCSDLEILWGFLTSLLVEQLL